MYATLEQREGEKVSRLAAMSIMSAAASAAEEIRRAMWLTDAQ